MRYYCPPRTVQRTELEQQKTSKKKDRGTFVEVTKDVNIGCANSRDSDRRDKRCVIRFPRCIFVTP